MVSVLDSDWAVRVRALARALRCVLRQDTLLSVPLSTQVYKMGTGEFAAGGNPAMD